MLQKVLITGAAGSIGSELARHVARLKPKRLLLLDQDETGIFNISQEIEGSTPFVADVTNRERIEEIFDQYKPDVVFHVAAYKHVPLMELQEMEAVRNNIFGTLNVVVAAKASGVKKFVFISTDKAVNPSSIMGATKRVGEMICQRVGYTAVRFGNVLNSRGSVLPIWREQIAKGLPIMVTHPAAERFFMTIEEAIGLTLEAARIGKGGEIFVFDMGEPVNILELAKKTIAESGKEVQIIVSELRPGEKLSEQLFTGEEVATKYEKIFVIQPQEIDTEKLDEALEKLKNRIDIRKTLKGLIPNNSL